MTEQHPRDSIAGLLVSLPQETPRRCFLKAEKAPGVRTTTTIIAVGYVIFAISLGFLWLSNWIADHGEKITASITRHETATSKGNHTYKLAYTFTVHQQNFFDSCVVPEALWNRVSDGSAAMVVLLPQLGSIGHSVIIGDYNSNTITRTASNIVLILIPVMVFVHIMWRTHISNARQLAESGTVVEADVTGKSEPGRLSRAIYYQFRFHVVRNNESTEEHVAGDCIVSEEVWLSTAVGDKITMLVDPRRPRNSMVYATGLFEIA